MRRPLSNIDHIELKIMDHLCSTQNGPFPLKGNYRYINLKMSLRLEGRSLSTECGFLRLARAAFLRKESYTLDFHR